MITMESIQAKLGFDPLTYVVTNEDYSTDDGNFNPFSVLTIEELSKMESFLRYDKPQMKPLAGESFMLCESHTKSDIMNASIQ